MTFECFVFDELFFGRFASTKPLTPLPRRRPRFKLISKVLFRANKMTHQFRTTHFFAVSLARNGHFIRKDCVENLSETYGYIQNVCRQTFSALLLMLVISFLWFIKQPMWPKRGIYCKTYYAETHQKRSTHLNSLEEPHPASCSQQSNAKNNTFEKRR